MTLKFYMTPGSCSTGIHILLETLELPFEVWIINLPAGSIFGRVPQDQSRVRSPRSCSTTDAP